MTTKSPRTRTGTFKEFQDFTRAVVRGERKVDPNEPKIWMERRDGDNTAERTIQSWPLGAGVKAVPSAPR